VSVIYLREVLLFLYSETCRDFLSTSWCGLDFDPNLWFACNSHSLLQFVHCFALLVLDPLSSFFFFCGDGFMFLGFYFLLFLDFQHLHTRQLVFWNSFCFCLFALLSGLFGLVHEIMDMKVRCVVSCKALLKCKR
jgi:hypothetical protein